MNKHGKQYQEATKVVDREKAYNLDEAVESLLSMKTSKFDETVELHLRTNADPKQTDQAVRGVATLPHGLGKSVRVLVFANGEAADLAKRAGADFVGDEDLIKQVEGGWTEFDVGLAVPDMMAKIGKLGRVLGRKGLMPNPRTGTMVQPRDVPKAVEEAKKGRVEYRTDRTAIIHVPVGKKSFPKEKLVDNINSVMDAVVKARPAGIKGAFIRTAFLTSTMGPSLKLDVNQVASDKVE
ncbi:MAG: 50S ribosomal protein L1 [SAR202 cluster bacterium]|nr:50S ribosomal protein L1 [SAR202 cluster bacterium]